MDDLLQTIAEKKAELDRLRPLNPRVLSNLEHSYDVELTYTSNAIEGNTLTQIETALIIEKGITVGGKQLREHLEAVDHYDAIRFVRELARRENIVAEYDIRGIHALVVRRSAPDIAGRYATENRFVLTETGRHAFASPAEVPALMGDFAGWLGTSPLAPTIAFEAHRRLVNIHPFNDGNGRTARLLMNLLLIRSGYPPVSVRPQDRLSYIRALQQSQAGHGDDAFMRLLHERLSVTLDEYLAILR